MHLLIVALFLSAVVTATIFDSMTSDVIPLREDVVSGDIACTSECVLLCKLTSGCIGGRYQPKLRTCGLTIQHGVSPVMYYKKSEGNSADVTFGIPCKTTSTMQKNTNLMIYGYDVKIYVTDSEASCANDCAKTPWCRSVDFNIPNSQCTLSGISSVNQPLRDGYNHWNNWHRSC